MAADSIGSRVGSGRLKKRVGLYQAAETLFSSLSKAGMSKTKGMTENNRMIKKASSKARGSEVPGLSAEALAKVEAYSRT